MEKENPLNILLKTLKKSEPSHISGSLESAPALIAGHCLTHSARPILLICPDEESMQETGSNLAAFSAALDWPPFEVLAFPTWDHSIYSSISPSIKVRLDRIRVLGRCLSRKNQQATKPLILLTTLSAANQATLPCNTLSSHCIPLKAGQSVGSRDVLVRKILAAGFLETDPVVDPGTFAVRGEIIDVFPPDQTDPLRIELFDDVIEKLRFFDPESQCTHNTHNTNGQQEILLTPAREVLMNPETLPRLREAAKMRADHLGIHRSVRDPVLSSMAEGRYPEHSDAWAVFAYPETATLWNYLGADWSVFWLNESDCRKKYDEFLADQLEFEKTILEKRLILPTPDELFKTEAIEKSSSLKQVFLDPLALHTESSALHIEIQPLTDFFSPSRHSLADLDLQLRQWISDGLQIHILASTQSQIDRIRYLLDERGITAFHSSLGSLSTGFIWRDLGKIFLSEHEVLGSPRKKVSAKTPKNWSGVQALSEIHPGEVVVHADHGIGLYRGLSRLNIDGAPSDFLQIEYAGNDKLYLPVYRLNLIQKHVISPEAAVLDRLGGTLFQRTKEKVQEAVRKLAVDLLKLYSQRKVSPGFVHSPRDTLFKEFEGRFEFEETTDQLSAIEDVMRDMESGKVMDRLICGDVGFGKTEVAIRAAFRAAQDGKQVAVLVPTTILAQQHEQSFKSRLRDYPLNIESLSRFKSSKKQKEILNSLKQGQVDIIIGTHRLLSKDIIFADLGLLIIDEEHRFGVEHKEKLKALKVNTHVLTLSATPIPRTLHMALSGLRDISLIHTPPVDRLPIRTTIARYDENLIRKAVETELARGGQVFFLHNRVQTIGKISEELTELIPQARICTGHGQMPERELEKTMLAFYHKEKDVLICSAIIESGLDIPSANTIIINRADTLGLAQLYQIRGRVGRSEQRAYAYLLIPKEGSITDEARKRLEVIQRFVELGSGFNIASHDLEIRGGGDLLGPQQSGNIMAVGFEMYTELLEEAVHELKGEPLAEDAHIEPEIKIPFAAFFSEEYIPNVHQRLSLYRRCSAASTEETLLSLERELKDRFGDLPQEAHNLLWLIRIKQCLKRYRIEALTAGLEKITLLPSKLSPIEPKHAIALMTRFPAEFQLTPDSRLVIRVQVKDMKTLLFELEKSLKRIVSL